MSYRESWPGGGRGCLDWQAQGLNPPQKVIHATDEYQEESDHVALFLGDAITIEEGGEVKASTLHNRYAAWCQHNSERAMSGTAFGQKMVGDGYTKKKTTHVFYLGITLNDPQT